MPVQGDEGDAIYFIDVGEVVATIALLSFEVGARVEHKKHGAGSVAEVTTEPSITRVVFDLGKPHSYMQASLHKLRRVQGEALVEPKVLEVARYRPMSGADGAQPFFGEASLLKTEPRPCNLTCTCSTDVTVRRLSAASFLLLKRQHDRKDDLLRGIDLFENFSDDQIGEIADLLQPRDFDDTEAIIIQGEEGHHFFILEAGEAVATIQDGRCSQEVKRYEPGELFGEKAQHYIVHT